MPPVLIIDLEVNPQTRQIFQIGALRPDSGEHYESPKLNGKAAFQAALLQLERLSAGAEFVMGHNIIEHDLPYLRRAAPDLVLHKLPVIDTLRLSPLAFPQNPYHRLIKNHKLIASALNSPLADCHACRDLFLDQCTAFGRLRETAPQAFSVYRTLFGDLPVVAGGRIACRSGVAVLPREALKQAVLQMLREEDAEGRSVGACMTRLSLLRARDLDNEKLHKPLAYALSWLKVAGGNSVLAPWVRHQFPDTARLIQELRDVDCGSPHCRYCRDTLNPTAQLIRYFGQDGKIKTFRDVAGVAGGQEEIVSAGMQGRHLLAVLPTGGGKSLCFQLPALNRYFRNGGLTVVVSPLQSLMKDQVDNLIRRNISSAATLNGMLSVPERADVLDKIALGDVGILFVAPEQFRNSSFIKAIEHRQINGWVFDEAHCLSKWGHDFRPDYLYAAKFIRRRTRSGQNPAPVSCFTATAKPDVLADINNHFNNELGIAFKQFIGSNQRDNLSYEVLDTPRDSKNQRIHELLSRELDNQPGGAVVFVASRKRAEEISEFLNTQQWACSHFHAGLAANEKADIQEAFINDELRVIVATNAFGMGVDKPNVRLVIHAEIPGSLENYLQEAGRAGRDQADARCVLLFDKQDIDAQFRLNKSSQIEQRDLKQVWGKLRFLNKSEHIVVSSGEILRDNSDYMSFDTDDRQADTKVKTAVSWLERAGLLERAENRTRIFPAGARQLNLEQALNKIKQADLPQRKQDIYSVLLQIIYHADESEPVNTDTLAEAVGSSYTELVGMLEQLEQLGVLSNDTHITINIRTDTARPSEKRLRHVMAVEEALWQVLKNEISEADQGIWQNVSLSALCREIKQRNGSSRIIPAEIKQLLKSLAQDKDAHKHSSGSFELKDFGNDIVKLRFKNRSDSWEEVLNRAGQRRAVCAALFDFLLGKARHLPKSKDTLVETTFGELDKVLAADLALAAIAPEKRQALLNRALLYLHMQEVFKLNHGMTVLRHAMTIRLNKEAVAAKTPYLKQDYQPLLEFYDEKRFQIHVMLEYAKKALENIGQAWKLVGDYFQQDEKAFKNTWFKGRLKELDEDVSKETYENIIGSLNEQQRKIVIDKTERNRLILAGPGSGKTRVIVARAAYLLKVRHVDPASVIILTFNRHAAREIKHRLFGLAGHIAAAVTVLTYDSMAMRLLGVRFDKPSGNRPSEDNIDGQLKMWCEKAAQLLEGNLAADDTDSSGRDNILAGFRYILVDEYQDITERHYRLVSALAGRQIDDDSKLTILAVGDDDQNIYAFNGSSNEYIHRFCEDYGVAEPDFLTFNYRSSQHIISAANSVMNTQPGRLKALHPIVINPERQKQPNGGIWAERDAQRQGRVRVLCLPQQGRRKQKNNRQAQAVAAEIRRLQALGAECAEMAVLAFHNDTLKPVQAWCEQTDTAYFKKSSLRPSRLRQFVRLLDELEKSDQAALTASTFVRLIRQQQVGDEWRQHFDEMREDFLQEHGMPSESHAAEVCYSVEYLKSWLYGYTGELESLRKQGLFVGTIHSAKGLEFKHVFILDGGWGAEQPEARLSESRRLYYVGMTRAIETLTLVHDSPDHAWLPLLPTECERVEQHFDLNPALDIEYRTLALTELDIGFAGRDSRRPPSSNNIKGRLKAIADLQVGDKLLMRPSAGCYEILSGAEVVGKTAKNTGLPELGADTEAFVADLYVRYREQEGAEYLGSYPENLPKWSVVVPKIMIKPE